MPGEHSELYTDTGPPSTQTHRYTTTGVQIESKLSQKTGQSKTQGTHCRTYNNSHHTSKCTPANNTTNTRIKRNYTIGQPETSTGNNITHCPDRRCPLHPRLIHSRTVRSKISRRTFQTHGAGDSNTPRAIYLIQCKHCGRQYVGQTAQPLRSRIAKHLTAIRNRHQPGVLHEHFRRGGCAGTNNVSVQFLDVIVPTDGDTAEYTEQQLKRLESLWMERLKSEYPQGLNWAKYDPKERSTNS